MSYGEQLARVRRLLKRFEDASARPESSLQPEERFECEDMMWAFFQNCGHLKDWILADNNAPAILKTAVRKLENGTTNIPSLMLCADLANRSKHQTLKKHIRRNATAHREIQIMIGDSFTGGGSSSVRYGPVSVTDNTGKSVDALTLARNALRDWANLISNNGGMI